MQITSCEFTNTKYIQIYLTEEELQKQETKEIIKKYKKENYPEILKKIIMKQKELKRNVC